MADYGDADADPPYASDEDPLPHNPQDESQLSEEYATDHDHDDDEGGIDQEEDDVDNDNNDNDDDNTRRHSRGDRTRTIRDYHHLRIKATPDLPLLSDPKIAPAYRDIGSQAHWSLSSTKPGNGVEQLRDSSLDTYWQSDGMQPHYIHIQFARRQTVSALAMYLDYSMDESYTPKKFVVKVGTTFHNLEEVRVVEVREPCGWCVVPLWRKLGEDVLDGILDPEGAESDDENDNDEEMNGNPHRRRKKHHHVPMWKRKPLRTHFVQVGIISMHQNGRDTHVRQVRVFGPRDDGSGGVAGRYGFGSSYRGLVSHKGGVGGKKKGGAAEMMMGSGRRNMPTFQTVGLSQFSSIR